MQMGKNIVVDFRDEHEQPKFHQINLYVKTLHDSECPFLYVSHISLVLAVAQIWELVIQCLFKYNLPLFSDIGLISHAYLN